MCHTTRTKLKRQKARWAGSPGERCRAWGRIWEASRQPAQTRLLLLKNQKEDTGGKEGEAGGGKRGDGGSSPCLMVLIKASCIFNPTCLTQGLTSPEVASLSRMTGPRRQSPCYVQMSILIGHLVIKLRWFEFLKYEETRYGGHTCNPSPWEEEEVESGVQGCP